MVMVELQNQNFIARIRNAQDLAEGVRQLRLVDRDLCPAIDALDEVPLRLRPPGFMGLAEIITAQQVSKASAAAIFGRMCALIDPMDAEAFLAAGEKPLIDAGQSRAKQVTLTGLARAIVEDGLDLEALCDVPVDDAMARLTALKGIGPWTAEVFLLFCAGHGDIFPAGDIALQHATGDLLGLAARPDIKQTRVLAERWSPLRGVASRVLYAHYARQRKRTDLPV